MEQNVNEKVNEALQKVNRRQFGDQWMDKRMEEKGVNISPFIFIFCVVFMGFAFTVSNSFTMKALSVLVFLGFIVYMLFITKNFNKDIEKFHILRKMNNEIDYKKVNIDATEFTICKYCGTKFSIHEKNCPNCQGANDRHVKENVNDEYNNLHNIFDDMLKKEYGDK